MFPFEIDRNFSNPHQFSDNLFLNGKENEIEVNYRFIWKFRNDEFKNNLNTMLIFKLFSLNGDFYVERKVDLTKELKKFLKSKGIIRKTALS